MSSRELLKQAFEVVRNRMTMVAACSLPSDSKERLLISSQIKDVFDNTLFGGKHSRARLAIDAFDALQRDARQESRLQFAQAAVTIEMLQSFFLILDDIMDSSETRRGKMCWYRRPDVGMNAINDALLLDVFVENILDDCLLGHPNLERIKNAFRKSKRNTLIGQLLDWKSQKNFENFTWERYENIVAQKTSDYTLWLPIQLALLGADNCTDIDGIKIFCYRIGFLFQSQDDYLDVFGDFDVTGKIGTDIQDGKCSWLSVRAMQLLEKKRDLRAEFLTAYGKSEKESTSRVLSIFDKLALKKEFDTFERIYSRQLVSDMKNDLYKPLQPVLIGIVEQLIGRDK